MNNHQFTTPGGIRNKPIPPKKEEFDSSSTQGYDYGGIKKKLKVGVEVEGNSSSSLVKVGAGTRSTTGNLVVTGVGFKPSSLRVVAHFTSGNRGMSDGTTDGTSSYCVNWFNNPTTPVTELTSNLIYANWSSPGTTVGNLVSFDNDGFTLNFSSIGPTISFYYEARK